MRTICTVIGISLLVVVAPAAGQSSTTGAITGRIMDTGGAAVVGATVVASSPVSRTPASAITAGDGRYRLAGLPAGVYTVEVYHGDAVVKRADVRVVAGKATPVHVKLDTSTMGEELLVIESSSPSIDLPGRTFESALGAAAGAQGDAYGVSLSGSTSLENTYLADGLGGTEHYQDHGTNMMTRTESDRFSTFAIDVDTASYTIMRTKIESGQRPPPASVRVEEYLNYFDYAFAGPRESDRPFAVHMDAAPSPYARDRTLLRIGVQARRVAASARKPANLVFLVDVSGSMSSDDKLGLAKRSLRVLVEHLDERDTVALVTYAGNTRIVLEPTSARDSETIIAAIEELDSGGSTAMGAGIELAYDLASKDIRPGTVSRVIVLSDGDANVGDTGHDAILETIAKQVKRGVTLTTVGFGMGNYQDHKMEQLANKGNGNNYYIDSIREAQKVFGKQLIGTLEVIAKDVKIQVEFNPRSVLRYRLVGYENRDIADEDFRDDKVDAGEIGAGHTVTAMYEVELTSATIGKVATVRLRAMTPRGTRASEVVHNFDRRNLRDDFDGASADFRFATAVIGAAEILRKSPFAGGWSLDDVVRIARGASSPEQADRQEFIRLMERAGGLEPHPSPYIGYDRRASGSYVAVGAAVGGLVMRGESNSTITPITSLRFGYGQGATDISVHLGSARSAAEASVAQTSTPIGDSLSVYSLGALLSHRLLPRSAIHPVAGVGVESLIVTPRNGDSRMAFAAIARVGLEVVHPTSLGNFALGFDATGHMPIVENDRMPMDLNSMITLGTYLDARF